MKRLLTLGLPSFSVLALGLPTAAQAATGNNAADLITAETDADVTFKSDETTVDPEKPVVVDPKDPESGGKDIDPGGSDGSAGNGTASFNINWVSNFRFKNITIGSKDMTQYAYPTFLTYKAFAGELQDPDKDPNDDPNSPDYNPYVKDPVAATKQEGLANFIQVTDNRGKENNGYKVSVKASTFTSDTAGELEGAQLYLTGGRFIGIESLAGLEPVNALAEDKDILETADSNVDVITAAPGKGIGTWTLAWGGTEADPASLSEDVAPTTGVKLVVPVKAKPQADATYKSTLTWSLVSVPEI